MNFGRIFRTVCGFSTQILRTQVFHNLSNKTLATPELVRKYLISRIPFHSPISQVSLYHGKRARHAVKSCFSEKKTNRLKKVNKLKKYFYSDVLGLKLHVRLSNKAFKCLKKMGSFDRYILCTPPKQLDSKIGEYYRTLMMRKINDPEYRIPYVIGSNRKLRIRQYRRYKWIKEESKFVIPKDFKKKLMTYQRKFGTNVDELNEEDYQKYLQVEKLKKLWGRDMDSQHPLLLEIKNKLQVQLTDEEVSSLKEKAEEYKQAYLNHPKNTQLRRQNYEYNEREGQKEHLRVKQAWIKKNILQQEQIEEGEEA